MSVKQETKVVSFRLPLKEYERLERVDPYIAPSLTARSIVRGVLDSKKNGKQSKRTVA